MKAPRLTVGFSLLVPKVMSFVYYSLTATSGPAFTTLASLQTYPWTTPSLLRELLLYYLSLDFIVYDERKLALSAHLDYLLPTSPFFTFSFDILDPPVPLLQSRFRNWGVYVSLSGDYAPLFVSISRALSIDDSDPQFDTYRQLFYSSVASLSALINSSYRYFDRATFELENVLLWAVYPPP